MKSFLYLLSFFISIPTLSIADIDLTINDSEINTLDRYRSLIEDEVTPNLLTNYKDYLEYPNAYWNFLENTFFYNWDFDATTRALIGNDIFNSFSDLQFKELSRALQVTLIRYAFESLSLYGEQRLSVIDTRFNEEQTLAWLKIKMESPRFPDIHLDLLLKRTNCDQWKGVDFRFKGITYVNLKKNGYRKDFERLQFKGLLRKLEEKNKVFFKDLCNGEANYLDPDNLPCL